MYHCVVHTFLQYLIFLIIAYVFNFLSLHIWNDPERYSIESLLFIIKQNTNKRVLTQIWSSNILIPHTSRLPHASIVQGRKGRKFESSVRALKLNATGLHRLSLQLQLELVTGYGFVDPGTIRNWHVITFYIQNNSCPCYVHSMW